MGCYLKLIAVLQKDDRVMRLAQSAALCDDGVQHGLKICRASGDDVAQVAVAVWCWSASFSSALRACTSSNSRAFSIAITA